MHCPSMSYLNHKISNPTVHYQKKRKEKEHLIRKLFYSLLVIAAFSSRATTQMLNIHEEYEGVILCTAVPTHAHKDLQLDNVIG